MRSDLHCLEKDSSSTSALPLSTAAVRAHLIPSLLCEHLRAIDNLYAPSFDADDSGHEQKNEKHYLNSDLAMGKAAIIQDVWF